MPIYPEVTYHPDVRINYDVYTFSALAVQWKLTVCRRENDPHSIIGVEDDNRVGQWFSAIDPKSFGVCLTPEVAYDIIMLAFSQWQWGIRHGERLAKLKMQEALGL